MSRDREISKSFLRFQHKEGRASVEMPTHKISQIAFQQILSYFVGSNTSIYLQTHEGTIDQLVTTDLLPEMYQKDTKKKLLAERARKIKGAERVIFLRNNGYEYPPLRNIRTINAGERFINEEFQYHAPQYLVRYLDACPPVKQKSK